MKKRCMKAAAILLMMVLLTGCQIVELVYEMTPEEEAQIVAYASKIISKYNAKQGDGMCRVYNKEMIALEKGELEFEQPPEEESEEETEEKTSETEEEEEEEKNPSEEETEKDKDQVELQEGQSVNEAGYIVNVDGSLLMDSEGKPVKANSSSSVNAAASQTANANTAAAENVATASITEALGIDTVEIAYQGFTISRNYKEGDYLSLSPSEGKQYLIMNFSLKNPSNEEKYIDILSQHPSFKVSVDGSERVKNESTILLYDLTTFQWRIPAGESTDAVLLFQIPSTVGSSSSTISLQLTLNDTVYEIELK